jgi:hypothetical protein
MSLARHAKARDGNEPQIVEALRRGGASVHRIDTPCDLLVGIAGRTHLVEVKRPLGPKGGMKDRNLTPDQRRFRENWKGSDLEILRTVDDAADWIKRKKVRYQRAMPKVE